MKKHLTSLKKISVCLLLFACWQIAEAQVTTSSMSGRISSSTETLPGATVRATHLPSGTVYGAVTNMEGRFNLTGMRAGGPYRVEVSFVGFTTDVQEIPSLALGENFTHNVRLREGAVALGEVVVVGSSAFQANRTGAAQTISAAEISRLPSINSSVADALRLNPQIRTVRGMSFAGANNRYNSFLIDGAVNNDVFGLASSGMNAGQAGAQPISMDAVEQIQISIAPFDVRQGGFTGGSINVVTKSGTNTLSGSAYGHFTNHNLVGRWENRAGELSPKVGEQSHYRAGMTLGGPIMKDKLFFFANYERQNERYPNMSMLGAANSNIDPVEARRIFDRIKQLAPNYRGELLESFEEYTLSDKLGIKLDYNINSRHTATLRWNLVSAKTSNQTPNSTNLNTSDYMYEFQSKTNTFVAELQSRFSNNVSNEFRASYVRVRDERVPYKDPFPMITISGVLKPGATGTATLNIGNERSSMANRLDQDVISITNNLNWFRGNHTITFGTHNEFFKFTNLFIQDFYGTYNFANVTDFINGRIQQFRFQEVNADITGSPTWAPTFRAGQLGFYAQNRWDASEKLTLTLGLRMDIPLFFDSPIENPGFNAYSKSKGWSYKTNQKMSSAPMWSPRAGFRWTLDDESNFVLRGGVGVFTGRIPFVWLSNSFTNTGVHMNVYNTTNRTVLDQMTLILNPHGQGANASLISLGTPNQSINVFHPDFRFAQNLRANLGFDFNFAGINWVADAIYSKTLNDIFYQDLARELSGETLGQRHPNLSFDQRPLVRQVPGTLPYNQILALSNTSKGYSYNLSLQGTKNFDFGLEVMAAYSYTQAKDMNSGGSSVATSNFWNNFTSGDPNNPALGYSIFNYPHKVNVAAFYSREFIKGQKTTFGLIYQGSSGAPYSVIYNGDMMGVGSTQSALIWIPTDAQIDAMNFTPTTGATGQTAQQQRDNLKAWIARDPYMSKNRGKYFERNGANYPFEHKFDFHFAHKINLNIGGHTQSVELTFDILNVGNMLNPTWGRSYTTTWSQFPIVYAPATGNFQFLQGPEFNQNSIADFSSRWRAQIGFRIRF